MNEIFEFDETPTGVLNEGNLEAAPGTKAASCSKLRSLMVMFSTCYAETTSSTVAFSVWMDTT